LKVRDVDIDPVTRLVGTLVKLPGIGPKGAQRIAMNLLRSPSSYAEELADSIRELARHTHFCSMCRNISTSDPCAICADTKRDRSVVCVVEEPADVTSIERTGSYRGVYHVLHGVLDPMEGVGPGDIRLDELVERIKTEKIEEVIIATNPDAEGEATAHHLAKRLKSLKLKITRIARGVPMGADLQYVDEITLTEAISGRRDFG